MSVRCMADINSLSFFNGYDHSSLKIPHLNLEYPIWVLFFEEHELV